MALNYRQAGVDIAAGDSLVTWLKSTAKAKGPMSDHVVSGIGGFAALFEVPKMAHGMKRPCLVSATDGIGTKLRLAIDYQRYEGLGQDLVAMCANDLICCGGQPLFFLDYFATGKLELSVAQQFLSGLRVACDAAGMALIGGETAEMPGMYTPPDFDCAGFAVGLVDAEVTWGGHRVTVGDEIIGVASSGCHSNGYSLLRKVFASDMEDWVDELLKPTALYPQLVKEFSIEHSGVHALAHITGGGITNVTRVLPENTHFELSPWQWPKIFTEVQKRTEMSGQEMLETLNCGVGLAIVVDSAKVSSTTQIVEEFGLHWYRIGRVVAGSGDPQVLYPD